jgi:hypothetical protein
MLSFICAKALLGVPHIKNMVWRLETIRSFASSPAFPPPILEDFFEDMKDNLGSRLGDFDAFVDLIPVMLERLELPLLVRLPRNASLSSSFADTGSLSAL